MSDDASAGKAEIVIVRRRGGDDGAGGKAGAWKIAYADFVTAMMAFFLVMWLINASNEETRAQVASYFNPVKLTDTSTGVRSLKDMKDTRSAEETAEGEAGEGTPPSETDIKSEAKLLANPPASLDRMAKTISDSNFRNAGLDSEVEIAPAVKPDTSNPGVGDPFDPQAWEKVKEKASAEKEEPTPPAAAEVSEVVKDSTVADAVLEPQTKTAEIAVEEKAAKDRSDDIEADDLKGDERQVAPNIIKAEADAIAKEIAEKLGPADKTPEQVLSVEPVPEGILISLTEQKNFEMFETGSAEPRPEAMKLVQAIADVVKSRDGYLVIRGHTDSRPYRNKYYDNWQLSTARAHFARYMLLRAGLNEARIRRIEGVADREPRNASDPQASENRRIEILIGGDQP
jgi:chemotaxis protein MotB